MYNGYTQTTDWVNKLTNITKSEQRIEKAKEMMQSLKQQVMAGKIPPGKGGSPGQPYQPPQPTGPYVPAPPRPTPPPKLAGGPALPGEPGRPGTPKAPGGRPHLPGEKPTPAPAGRNPQLPGMKLAQVDYTSPHPKFDQHMKNTPPLSQPKDRIDHLKKGVTIRKA